MLRFAVHVVYSTGFDKSIMACIQRDGITQSVSQPKTPWSFTCLFLAHNPCHRPQVTDLFTMYIVVPFPKYDAIGILLCLDFSDRCFFHSAIMFFGFLCVFLQLESSLMFITGCYFFNDVPQFICPPTAAYLGCSEVLVIRNKSATNANVQLFVRM